MCIRDSKGYAIALFDEGEWSTGTVKKGSHFNKDGTVTLHVEFEIYACARTFSLKVHIEDHGHPWHLVQPEFMAN